MDKAGLLVALLVFLMGEVGRTEPDSGYCIGNECFTLFRTSGDFLSAQASCRQRKGFLMTVRSSVSHDTLSILLGNFTGSFWIGLQLPSGCPDPTAGLKGYEWVTKDRKSDFTNWLPTFDSSCSAPGCVSVSKQNEFKWTQMPCHGHAEGFLCENNFTEPCPSLPAAPGESVSYVTPYGFGGDDVLSLPPGSVATRKPSEQKYLCHSKKWLHAPWSCEIFEGGCEHKCTVDPNKDPSCYCPAGQTVSPVNKVTCEGGLTDDPCARLRCDHVCYQYKDGSYRCTCENGFQLAADGRTCTDFDECADARQCPGMNVMCVNTVGSFACVCKEGYRASGGQCVDTDECASGPCEHDCVNYPGGYTCTCFEGYVVSQKSPDKCELFCGAAECPAVCDPNNRFQCYCPQGYLAEERDSGTFCVEIDECQFLYCDQNCENSFGSYVCTCNKGYTLVDGFKCVKDEDEETDTGSGMSPSPNIPTESLVPHPGPTQRPAAVTAGWLVGIIVCTVFFIVLLVFGIHVLLSRRGAMETGAALKAPDGETHGLQQVSGDY